MNNRWSALEQIENENNKRKQTFLEAQPEYDQWLSSRPSRILGNNTLTASEKMAAYRIAADPDSEWNRLDAEFTRRWVESGNMVGKNYQVCEFF